MSKRRRSGKWLGAGATIGVALAVLAVGPARADAILRRVIGTEPRSLDPYLATDNSGEALDTDLFEGLTARDSEGRVVPGVAERWETSADGKVLTFHLRRDAAWSNGEPLVARDFVYAFRRAVLPGAGWPYLQEFTCVAGAAELGAGRQADPTTLGVRAADPFTLVLTLTRPCPSLPAFLVDEPPLAEAALAAAGADWLKPGRFVGNGAFALAGWTPQAEIVLRKNAYFHDAAAVAADEVRWILVEDDFAALKRYRAGDLDISRAPASETDWARRTFGAEFHVAPTDRVRYLAINLRAEPLGSRPNLRKALALVIDRESLVQQIEPDGRAAVDTLIPAAVLGVTPANPWYRNLSLEARRQEAKRLFAEAGYGPGRPLKLTALYGTSTLNRKELTAVADSWRDVLGAEVELVNVETTALLDDLKSGHFQIGMESLGVPIPEFALDHFMRASDRLNDVGYAGAEFERLMEAGVAELDPASRAELFRRAETRLLDDAAIIPLHSFVSRTLVKPWIGGWHDNSGDNHPSRYLTLGRHP